MIDAGWPGYEGRDADRILAAVRDAGIKQIDYLMVTHYHRDHVGGVPQLAESIKIGTFVDHGPNSEDTEAPKADYAAYQKAIEGHAHVSRTLLTLDAQEHLAEAIDGAGLHPLGNGERGQSVERPEQEVHGVHDVKARLETAADVGERCRHGSRP